MASIVQELHRSALFLGPLINVWQFHLSQSRLSLNLFLNLSQLGHLHQSCPWIHPPEHQLPSVDRWYLGLALYQMLHGVAENGLLDQTLCFQLAQFSKSQAPVQNKLQNDLQPQTSLKAKFLLRKLLQQEEEQ